jgi:hypothetical protein
MSLRFFISNDDSSIQKIIKTNPDMKIILNEGKKMLKDISIYYLFVFIFYVYR